MELKTERLILRDLRKTDAKDIKDNVNNIKVSEFLLVVPYPYSIKNANWFINDCSKKAKKKPRESYTFGIELKSEKRLIGIISIGKINKFGGNCEIGYWLGEKYWRQGIMTEAFKEVLNFSFAKLNLRRINIYAFAENEASNGLIKKMGFRFEGCRKQAHKDKATKHIHDDNEYGLLKEEWKNKILF